MAMGLYVKYRFRLYGFTLYGNHAPPLGTIIAQVKAHEAELFELSPLVEGEGIWYDAIDAASAHCKGLAFSLPMADKTVGKGSYPYAALYLAVKETDNWKLEVVYECFQAGRCIWQHNGVML